MGSTYRRRWRAAAIAAGLALVSSGLLTGTGAATSDTRTGACPRPVPVSELTEGMNGTGRTVERGTTADSFTAEVLGVIDDGIATGVDMIIVDTGSPAIQRAGGIWSGMSGSPVYADDGRLIGAVAYGLSLAPSSIAGLVPAEDMLRLLDRQAKHAADTEQAQHVELPRSLRQNLVRSGSANSAQAGGGMSRLALPVSVSGLSSERIAKVAERMQDRTPHTRFVAAGAASDSESSTTAIFPGSNFAASLSHGDVTAAGVGTTTMVCGDAAVAFGHPFLWTGTSSMSVHAAKAIYVQRDDTVGSFKVANPLGVVGTLDQDRLAGIRAQLGSGPATTPVTSIVTSDDSGDTRTGRTNISMPDFIPDLAASHVLANLDSAADFMGKGSGQLRWTIDGTRASGAGFQLELENRYASPWDIAWDSTFDLYDQLAAIQGNRFEDVEITGVRIVGTVSSAFQQYSIADVALRQPDGSYETLPEGDVIQVPAGTRLDLRVTLAQHRNADQQRTVNLAVTAPAESAGGYGSLIVSGGKGADFGGDELFEDGGDVQAASFDELLAQLQDMPRNDAVHATLMLDSESGSIQRVSQEMVEQVVSGEYYFPIEVVDAEQ